MPRLLAYYLQIHPAMPRVEIGAAVAKDSLDFATVRRYEPDTQVKIEDFDAELAKSPPSSTADLMAICARLVSRATTFPCSVQQPAPPPEPEPAPVEEPAAAQP